MLFCHKIHYIWMINAKSCRRDLRTFSANFSGMTNSLRHFFCFLDVWVKEKRWGLGWGADHLCRITAYGAPVIADKDL